MKKMWLTLAGIGLLAVSAAMILPRSRGEARAEPDDKKATTRTVTASGSGSMTTTADVVRINVNVTSLAATSQGALVENEKKVKKLETAVRDLQIVNLKSTVLFAGSYKTPPPQPGPGGMNPMDGPAAPPTKKIDSYSAAHTLQIVLKNEDAVKLIDAADRVAKALRANGLADLTLNYTTSNFAGQSNYFGGGGFQPGFQFGGFGGGGFNQGGMPVGFDNQASVVFQREDTTDLRRKALTKAVETALGNARAMTDGAKVRLLDVTSISDQRLPGMLGSSIPTVTAHHPTDIVISVDVTVICGVKD